MFHSSIVTELLNCILIKICKNYFHFQTFSLTVDNLHNGDLDTNLKEFVTKININYRVSCIIQSVPTPVSIKVCKLGDDPTETFINALAFELISKRKTSEVNPLC